MFDNRITAIEGLALLVIVLESVYVEVASPSRHVPKWPVELVLIENWKPLTLAWGDDGLYVAVHPRPCHLTSMHIEPYGQFTLSRATVWVGGGACGNRVDVFWRRRCR